MIAEIFKTSLTVDTLDLNLTKLKQECLKIYKYGNNRVTPRLGGFQSFNLDPNNTKLIDMINLVTQKANFYATNVLKLNKTIELKNFWFNINNHKDYILEHIHSNSIISGAFYVSVPSQGGDLYFRNPIDISNFLSLYLLNSLENKSVFKENNSHNCTKTIVPAVDAQLILFPSWLSHGVYPNLNKTKQRISFSFNFM